MKKIFTILALIMLLAFMASFAYASRTGGSAYNRTGYFRGGSCA